MRVCVAHDVRERLLDDPICGHLHSRRKGRQQGRRFDSDGESAGARAVLRGGLAKGADKAKLIKRGRAQVVDQAADVGQRRLDIVL